MKIQAIIKLTVLLFFSNSINAQLQISYYYENFNVPIYLDPIILENYVDQQTNAKIDIVLSPIRYSNPSTLSIDNDFSVSIGEVTIPSSKFNSLKTLSNLRNRISDPNSDREQNRSTTLVGYVLHYLKNNKIKVGCKIGAKISVDQLKKWGTAGCLIPEPTQTSKIACAIGLALKNKVISSGTAKFIEKGCVITIETTVEKTVEIFIEVKEELPKQKEEIINTINFLNTIEGMLWVQSIMSGGGKSSW